MQAFCPLKVYCHSMNIRTKLIRHFRAPVDRFLACTRYEWHNQKAIQPCLRATSCALDIKGNK